MQKAQLRGKSQSVSQSGVTETKHKEMAFLSERGGSVTKNVLNTTPSEVLCVCSVYSNGDLSQDVWLYVRQRSVRTAKKPREDVNKEVHLKPNVSVFLYLQNSITNKQEKLCKCK